MHKLQKWFRNSLSGLLKAPNLSLVKHLCDVLGIQIQSGEGPTPSHSLVADIKACLHMSTGVHVLTSEGCLAKGGPAQNNAGGYRLMAGVSTIVNTMTEVRSV